MFSDKELAMAFLEEMLSPEIVNLLDLSTLSYNDKSYITPELDEIFSDMVMDIDLKSGENIQVAILLEHKSYIDSNVTVQILRYLGEAYHKQLTAKEPLRPILPVIYYHGNKEWKFEQFSRKFDKYPDLFIKHLPVYTTEFVDLSKLSEIELGKLRNSMLHATLEIQRFHSNPEALIQRLGHIAENLNPYLNSSFTIKILIYLLQTTEVTMEDFKRSLPTPLIEKVMSTYDRIMAEGIEKGVDKGVEKERVRGVLHAFDNGFDLKTIQLFTGESLEKINAILKENGRI